MEGYSLEACYCSKLSSLLTTALGEKSKRRQGNDKSPFVQTNSKPVKAAFKNLNHFIK